MTQKCFNRVAMVLTAFALVSLPARPAAARAPQQDQQKPTYTIPEYNAFQAANAEKDPQAKIKLLDDFVGKYPSSTLMQYVYQLYYQAYSQLKNYAKAIEFADKLTALGDKADLPARLQALQARVQAFPIWYAANPKAPDAIDQLAKERDAALLGAKLLEQLPKPANVTDEQFAGQKKPGVAFFSAAAGFADLQLKDNAAAVGAFKTVLANTPNDPISEYRLGLAYLALTPPQSLNGFWALARAINHKVSDSGKIKDYLRSRILAYEQPGCESQVDAQLNELLQLTANAPEPPATYSIPTQDDLKKIRDSSNILTVISDLSAGGDKAKMTWLAICSAEFPEVVGKIIEVRPSQGYADFMVYTGATPDDMQAATTANMDVKVWTSAPPAGSTPAPITPQPDVVRLQKDDGIRFSGTLVSYDPTPFLLHWDQVKVDPSVLPEKSEGKRAAPRKVPPKKP